MELRPYIPSNVLINSCMYNQILYKRTGPKEIIEINIIFINPRQLTSIRMKFVNLRWLKILLDELQSIWIIFIVSIINIIINSPRLTSTRMTINILFFHGLLGYYLLNLVVLRRLDSDIIVYYYYYYYFIIFK